METIYLSRRNLLTLLNKLDRTLRGDSSACTIVKFDNAHPQFPQTMSACAVVAVENDVYYTDREPGQMHPKDTPA